MTEWMWIALGYGLTYGSFVIYIVVLGLRWGSLHGRGDQR